jgi:hypothetical protein
LDYLQGMGQSIWQVTRTLWHENDDSGSPQEILCTRDFSAKIILLSILRKLQETSLNIGRRTILIDQKSQPMNCTVFIYFRILIIYGIHDFLDLALTSIPQWCNTTTDGGFSEKSFNNPSDEMSYPIFGPCKRAKLTSFYSTCSRLH